MRICFIGHFTSGGTERATFLVANGLKEQHDIFLVNTCDRQPSFYLKEGINMEYLPSGNIPKRVLALVRYLKKRKIDILITVEALTGIVSVPAAMLTRCKHIVWEHANYFQNQGSRYIQKVRQIELKTADAYVVLTKKDLKNFQQHFLCKTTVEQIYNIADGRNSNVYDEDSKTIVSAGHIWKIKNFIVIPDLAKVVFEKHPDWKWIIYGNATGEEYEKILRKVQEYGLEQNIIFYGRCENMESEYQKAAMYVMTSLQEGLPMVLLEAKSNGLPLVSFDIETGPSEIIRDGENGFLVPPYDIECMEEKICRLIEDNDLRKRFAGSAKMDLEKFDSDTITKQWDNLIRTCVEK